MEMIRILALAALTSCAAVPVAAMTCLAPDAAYQGMKENGFTTTFTGDTGNSTLMLAENKDGQWILFAVLPDRMCLVANGKDATHIPLPPNT